MNAFKKIVVIGAGTMGSGIAAHLANSNREVILLDLKGKESANQISEKAIDIIKKSAEDKVSLKAVLEVSPNYLIKSKNKNMNSKIRIVADACFR